MPSKQRMAKNRRRARGAEANDAANAASSAQDSMSGSDWIGGLLWDAQSATTHSGAGPDRQAGNPPPSTPPGTSVPNDQLKVVPQISLSAPVGQGSQSTIFPGASHSGSITQRGGDLVRRIALKPPQVTSGASHPTNQLEVGPKTSMIGPVRQADHTATADGAPHSTATHTPASSSDSSSTGASSRGRRPKSAKKLRGAALRRKDDAQNRRDSLTSDSSASANCRPSQIAMPPPAIPPRRRGRPSKQALYPQSVCSDSSSDSASTNTSPRRKRGRHAASQCGSAASSSISSLDLGVRLANAPLLHQQPSAASATTTTRAASPILTRDGNTANAGLAPIQPTSQAVLRRALPYALNGHPSVADAIEAYDIHELVGFFGAFRRGVEQLRNDPTLWMDVQTVFAYLCFVAHVSAKRVAVVSPNYSSRDLQCAAAGAWGAVRDYEFLLIPYLMQYHFVLIVHERNGGTLFYDSLPHGNRLDQQGVREKIQSAIVHFEPHFDIEDIDVRAAASDTYNLQQDPYNCGTHVCVIAESILMNGTALLDASDFNITHERNRILDYMWDLVQYHNPPYQPRPVSLFDHGSDGDDEDDSDSQSAPISRTSSAADLNTLGSQVSQLSMDDSSSNWSTGSTSSRRSSRSTSSVNYSDTRRRRRHSSADLYTPMKHCHKRHPRGCFAKSSYHYHEYFDCGNLGDKKCTHCGALLLRSESFHSCCSKGAVKLAALPENPIPLAAIFSDPRLSRHLYVKARLYNCLLRFGTLTADRRQAPGAGYPVVLMNGDIHHRISNIFVRDGQQAAFGQLYLFDQSQAANCVQNASIFDRRELRRDVFCALHKIICDNHVLSRQFKNLKDQYDQKLLEAQALGLADVPTVTLILVAAKDVPEAVRDPRLHARQVNLPYTDEFCAIHVSNDPDEPIYLRGTRLQKNSGAFTDLGAYEPLTDPAHYVLALPYGSPGYHFGIPKIANPCPAAPPPAQPRPTTSRPDSDTDTNNSELDDFDSQVQASQDVPAEMKKQVSIRQFYRYRLAIRGDPRAQNHFLFPLGAIAQEYVIDQSFKVNRYEYDYLQKNADLYYANPQEVINAIAQGAQQRGHQLGKVFRFPPNVRGTASWYQRKFHDAMALFTTVGQPTFMITLTCNPRWPEVKRHLAPGQNATNRFDVSNRVFAAREQRLSHLVHKQKGAFGTVLASCVALEFQKRGPPHTHRLIRVEGATATADFVDDYISAEIPPLPHKDEQSVRADMMRALHNLVLEYQVHFCDTRCLTNGKCQKGFPRKFSPVTIIYGDRPPIYKRRSPEMGGLSVELKKKKQVINNANIVPYNAALLLMWGGHCNVEYCWGSHAAKYAIKYTFKGGSYAYILQTHGNVADYNEATALMKGTYRTAPEAHTILYNWPIVRMSHTIMRLSLYLPGEAPYFFHRTAADQVKAKALANDIKLTYFEAFMKQCAEEKAANTSDLRNYTFVEVPKHYWFDKKASRWVKRTREESILGRLYSVSPVHLQKFALYQLVRHTKGPCCWPDLRTDPATGIACTDFIECAQKRGLLDDQDVWRRTLQEAVPTHSPNQMLRLFAQILVHSHPADPLSLWTAFQTEMYDARGANTPAEHQRRGDIALNRLNRLLNRQNCCNKDFGLPLPFAAGFAANVDDDVVFFGDPDDDDGGNANALNNITNLAASDTAPLTDYYLDARYTQLNDEQQQVVDKVVLALEDRPPRAPLTRLFFMNGSAGTGKTFVYNAIIHLCVKHRIRCLVTASTGIAATGLPRGTTTHSAFRLPLDVYDPKITPPVEPSSGLGRRVSKTELLIVDEVTMLHRALLNMIDNLCRHCAPANLRNEPFGGKVVLLGGDWRQLLPVVPRSTLVEQAQASVKNCSLYPLFEILRLVQNMRVLPTERDYIKLLDRVGTDSDKSGKFTIPLTMKAKSQDELVQFVYGGVNGMLDLQHKLLLAPTRCDVAILNADILKIMPGAEREYLSCDLPLRDTPLGVHNALNDVSVLNAETPTGMPPHRLVLKKGAIVVLLRNVDVYRGLSNGTRLEVMEMGQYLLQCKVAAGPFAGKQVSLNLFRFEYEDKRIDGTGLHFARIQYPVQLAFALTINKAQGQTVTKMGLMLNSPIFSHGQLYVALSRVRAENQVKIFVQSSDPNTPTTITNVVIRSILD